MVTLSTLVPILHHSTLTDIHTLFICSHVSEVCNYACLDILRVFCNYVITVALCIACAYIMLCTCIAMYLTTVARIHNCS